MGWRIDLDPSAEKELDQIGNVPAKRILRFLFDRLTHLDDPRSIGEALTGPRFGQLWKYRVGDYRLIAEIKDRQVQILIIRIGHRRQVYR
jgi:mRNA interferase RelE/StbE